VSSTTRSVQSPEDAGQGCPGELAHGLSRRRLVAGAFASIAAVHAPASGGEPVVRLLVPFPAGGSLDALARLLAPPLGRHLEATVVVMNLPGGAGQLAAQRAAHAPSDGNTLLLGTSATHAIAVTLFPDLGYRPEQDFAAVGCICTGRLVLVASPALEARSLADLVRIAHAAPAPLAYGSWGVGSGGHLMVEAIRRHAGIELIHVPFRGVGPMLQSVLGDQIPLAVSDVAGVASLVRAKKVVPLAVSGTTRLPWMPDVGTLAEAQIAVAPESWCALFAGKQTPEAEMARLDAALQATLKEVAVAQAIGALMLETSPLSRTQFQALWHDDIDAWHRLIVATGVKLD
jgi:tripartite-type tricarboxylate transporter receptor subunit TctC